MNPKIKLGDLVKKQRLKRELSQQQLAEGIGVSLRTINDIECYRANPRFDTLCSLFQYLQVPTQNIFTQEPDSVPEPAILGIIQEELADYSPGDLEVALQVLKGLAKGLHRVNPKGD
ncbi:MAG: helix-turn-helix transcriptional regulator [Hespellia sp.]|nr:helix-turn-helix transcriptional regulator [Hespellia sp.]